MSIFLWSCSAHVCKKGISTSWCFFVPPLISNIFWRLFGCPWNLLWCDLIWPWPHIFCYTAIYIHMNLNVTWYMMSWLSFSPIFNKEPPPKNELHVFHLKFWCPQSPKFWHFRKLKMIETLGVLGSICFRLREGHMFFLKFVCYLGNLCKELLFCKSLFSNHISTCKSIQPTPHTFFLCYFLPPPKKSGRIWHKMSWSTSSASYPTSVWRIPWRISSHEEIPVCGWTKVVPSKAVRRMTWW